MGIFDWISTPHRTNVKVWTLIGSGQCRAVVRRRSVPRCGGIRKRYEREWDDHECTRRAVHAGLCRQHYYGARRTCG